MKAKLISVLDWLLHYFAYAIILILVATYFKSFTIDDSHMYTYGMLATLIIFALNKTIKPIFLKVCIPLIGITAGLFYPIINVFILKITEWILGPKFDIRGIFTVFFIAILISVANYLIDDLIIKPIIRRIKKNG